MLMPLYRTTRSVGTARSNDNINGNVQNYSDRFSDVLHWQNKCLLGLGGLCQDYKEWESTKLAIHLGAGKGPLGKL